MVAAKAAAAAAYTAQQNALAALVAALKKNLRYAENTVDFDDHKLKLIGWSGKRSARTVEPPGQTGMLRAIMWLLKFPRRLRGATGLTVAQIGEFSFLLITIAFSHQLINVTIFRYIISVTLLSIISTPYLIRLASWYFLRRGKNRGAKLTAPEPKTIESPVSPILIIGFGPAGREVGQELSKLYGRQIVALDLNPRHQKDAQEMGISFAVGDATHPETLADLSVDSARAVVITLPDPKACQQIIRLCKTLAPGCPVIVRCRYHRYRDSLQHAGANSLIDEEQHVGSALAQETIELLHESCS